MKLFLKIIAVVVLAMLPLYARKAPEDRDLMVVARIMKVTDRDDGRPAWGWFRAKVLKDMYARKGKKPYHKEGDELDVKGFLEMDVFIDSLQPETTCYALINPQSKNPELWRIDKIDDGDPAVSSEIGTIINVEETHGMSDEMKKYLEELGAGNVPPPRKK